MSPSDPPVAAPTPPDDPWLSQGGWVALDRIDKLVQQLRADFGRERDRNQALETELATLRTSRVVAPTPETPSQRVIAELVAALKAVLLMADTEHPRKLDAALAWRQNDELAKAMAADALAHAEALAGAVSHPQPDRETFEQMDARIKAEMHAEEVEEGIVSDEPTLSLSLHRDPLAITALLDDSTRRIALLENVIFEIRHALGPDALHVLLLDLPAYVARVLAHPVVSPRTET